MPLAVREESARMAGVLDNPKVEPIFGLHVWPGMTTGHFAGAAGVVLAAAGAFEITIQGKGGHGAMPHLTIDPIACVAKLIVELQMIVSRETDPFAPTVVNVASIRGGSIHVGSIHGGEAMNVIPASVKITGTFRSLTNPGIALVKQRIQEMTVGIATTNRCQATVTFPIQEYPPTINDESSRAVSRKAAEAVVGPLVLATGWTHPRNQPLALVIVGGAASFWLVNFACLMIFPFPMPPSMYAVKLGLQSFAAASLLLHGIPFGWLIATRRRDQVTAN